MRKLLFIYDHKDPDNWMDGLWGALNELEKDFEVTRLNLRTDIIKLPREYDFILAWGAFGSLPDRATRTYKGKKGLCIAGNATPPHHAHEYDVLFYETTWYRDQINFHDNIVQAFGINTDIFSEVSMPMPIVWDWIGVGALANWKHWEKMTELEGNKLVVGEYQKDNEDESLQIARELLKGGVMVSPTVHPLDLANFYHWSRKAYIPADIIGGGERSVWEAKACGLEVKIENNDKLKELVEAPIPSHIEYAKKLKEGIESCL